MSEPKQRDETDPRYQRVRASLRTAALNLCQVSGPEQVSVAQIAQEAEVHRTSFYSHAASVVELLADALWEQTETDIATLNERLETGEVTSDQYWLSFYRIFLLHVMENKLIYQRLLEENSATIVALRRRVEEASRESLQLILSHWPDENLDELWVEMALQQHSAGVFAVTVAWLRQGMTSSVNEVLSTYRTMAPPWQLAREEGGHISIRRAHR